ncbi:hypothetical protein SO802_014197 [Lithocarpus litseifolius]|uniref:RNase H type-1 domain-containing protein n=1 Tax=Lithocarpus litseifolius TaxID=425828 RepID=A0AAW2CQD6_9ROSI
MKKGVNVFCQGIRWLPGRNSNISFWNDKWLNQGPVRQLIQGPLPLASEEDKIKDMVTSVGWNWAKIPFELPLCIKKEIQATPFALIGTSLDRLIWMGSRDGEFDLKSAYRQTAELGTPRQFHGNIGVKDRLVAREMVMDLACPLCHSEDETIAHALRDCPVSMQTWNDIGVSAGSNNFFSQNLHTWLAENCTVERGYARCAILWKVLDPFAVWLIWENRNQVVFKSKNSNLNLAKDIIQRSREFFFCAFFPKVATNWIVKHIRWERPTSGWVKLNTDGSSLGNPGMAGSGGVIRDEEGNWLVGFARNIGITTSFQAELWGLRDGLTLCVEHNFSAVEVELDARVVLDVIASLVCSNSLITSLVDDCKQLASRISWIRFNHCYREANRSADKLARMGAVQQRPFIIFLSLPVGFINIFESELIGETIARACPESVVSI